MSNEKKIAGSSPAAKPPDGGPVFFFTWWDQDSLGETKARKIYVGLTKREYFAAMAMQNIVSTELHRCESDLVVERAVYFADALLAALGGDKEGAS